jgi:hypothetical protein
MKKGLTEEKQKALMEELSKSYELQLDEQMGFLHNQFETFISASRLPISHVVMVLEMLKTEAIAMAFKKYMKE